ncbi:MmcQ/YjbR family DNA-binding protein [Arthrobacter sp. A2-55]|uniref:MmcQ/YjbR family DNA-binding protein n=1 Tax=Arthrobacter sp. A2-55 TaxID=2897337 RepID=UPI0021CD5CA2|nr:MmcQ/YjbR family DNA-binding protein [Arthrobacter sp. A2-55]MCU6480707.1 MmcQ/YjbR family DNA-binding protein [Arthrobacter sp. A2-55]
MSISAAEFRAAALKFPGSYEDFPFGPETSVFKVRAPSSGGDKWVGKMFAAGRLDSAELSVSLKCDPELAPQLRAANPAITPGYHMNKRHWNTVDCTAADAQTVLDLLEDSYDLVVAGLPKKQQTALEWSARVAKE